MFSSLFFALLIKILLLGCRRRGTSAGQGMKKQKKAAGRQLCEPSCVPGLRTDTSEEAGVCHVYLVELLTNGWPQPTITL